MSSTTLRGIFPEPKPVYRKNFMKENVKLIKKIQERHANVQQQLQPATKSLSNTNTNALLIPSKYKNVPTKAASGAKKRPTSLTTQVEPKSLNKGVQTERVDSKSPKIIEKSPKKTTTTKTRASGDHVEKLTKKINKIDLENKTDTTKLKKNKETTQDDRAKIEKNCKTDTQIGQETDKSGLIVLPDDERREYLRVARENYASLIKELNTMPIRNDTLRKRNRKIEIETELKRLEEVIKIFQKPKVFVKAD